MMAFSGLVHLYKQSYCIVFYSSEGGEVVVYISLKSDADASFGTHLKTFLLYSHQ